MDEHWLAPSVSLVRRYVDKTDEDAQRRFRMPLGELPRELVDVEDTRNEHATRMERAPLRESDAAGFFGHNGRLRRPIPTAALPRKGIRCIFLAALWLGLVIVPWLATAGEVRADGGAPNLAYVVVSSAGGGNLVVIDVAQQRVVGRVALGGDPQAVVLSSDGASAYVTQAAANSLAVVDARTRRMGATIPLGRGPSSVAFVANTDGLYIADTLGDTVTILDLRRLRVIGTIPVGKQPMGIAASQPFRDANGNYDEEVYVANAGDDTVSVISARREQVIATIPVPDGPQGVVVPSASGVAYVSARAGSVFAIDIASHRLLGVVFARQGSTLGTMDYDALTGQIYVPDATQGDVYVLRPVSPGVVASPQTLPNQPARTIACSGGPAAVAITFDGAYLFVAQHNSGQIAMYDAPARRLLATISVGGAPSAVVTGPYPLPASGQSAKQPLRSPSTGQSTDVSQLPIVGIIAALVLGLLAIGVFVALHRARVGRTIGKRR